jgi:hypothetical protein
VHQVQRPDPRCRWSSQSTPGAVGVLQEQSGVLQEQSKCVQGQSGDTSAQLALSGEGTRIGVRLGTCAQCPGGVGALVHAGAN